MNTKQPKDNKKIKNKRFTLKLGLYFSFLVSIIIIATTSSFAFFTMLYMKNVASNYEIRIKNLQYSLISVIRSAAQQDKDSKNLKYTKEILNQYRENEIFIYATIQNQFDGSFVAGDTEEEIDKKIKTQQKKTVELPPIIIGEYVLKIGIPEESIESYSDELMKIIYNILAVFALIGILGSLMMSGVVLRPLETLSIAAKNITDGNFDVQIKNTRFSEINDLIYSYNEMAFQLNELYSSLELKVQERTLALKEANHKLQETQAMMVHSEKMRSLGELVAGIAHEINNPINFIHGNIIILQNYADDLLRLIDLYEANNINIPEEIKEEIKALKEEIDLDFLREDIKDLIRSCIEGTERTKNIVLDLKNFSRMEEMVLTQFDIPKEIDTTLNILNNKYKNRIEVIKNYSNDVPKIEAYGGQLNQVFMNILDNAQDAMGEKGTLTINTKLIDENKVRIEFIDSGAGIPEENLKKVFDPFFTTKAVGKGTGLGMSISYRVINDHKGTIEVESELNKGTKFIITLPINHSKDNDDKANEEDLQQAE